MPVHVSLTHCRRLFVRVLTGRCVTLRGPNGTPVWTTSPWVWAARHRRIRKSVIIVVQGVGRVILRVLQPRDQSLIFIPEFPSHQGRLSDDHHILGGERKIRTRRPFFVRYRRCIVHSRWIRALPFPPLVRRPLGFWNWNKNSWIRYIVDEYL